MRKFRDVFKEKQTLSESLHEKNVLESFEKVYSSLLEKYGISNFKNLNEDHQTVFLAELNSYWDEKEGILPKGEKFLAGNSDLLNESSTAEQRKNFMKKRSVPAISETLRQSGLKWKLYNIIDEMYQGVGASDLGDVLDPKEMTEIMVESFRESVRTFMTEVKYELTENAGTKKNSELNERQFSEKERMELAKKGYAMPDGGFPIVTKKDCENAVKAFGRGNQPRAEKAHILKRAKALGCMDVIPDKWKSTNEGLGDLFKKKQIKLSGEFNTEEAHSTAKYVLELLDAAGIKANVSPGGAIKTSDKNMNLGTITPEGYLYVPGAGNWAPEDFSRNEKNIITGMQTCSDIKC